MSSLTSSPWKPALLQLLSSSLSPSARNPWAIGRPPAKLLSCLHWETLLSNWKQGVKVFQASTLCYLKSLKQNVESFWNIKSRWTPCIPPLLPLRASHTWLRLTSQPVVQPLKVPQPPNKFHEATQSKNLTWNLWSKAGSETWFHTLAHYKWLRYIF